MLGEGQYCRCYKGSLVHEGQTVDVAIKILKESMDKGSFTHFLKEIEMMAYVGQHENVVKFHGAMVERIADRKEY